MKNNDRSLSNKPKTSNSKRHYSQMLQGKVVLLIGYDTAVVRNLLIDLARKGADIALICRQHLSRETVHDITRHVEDLGRRLLLLVEANNRSPTWLIQTVKTNLGSLDMFIDLSAQKSAPIQNGTPESTESLKQNWDIMQAAMKAIATSETVKIKCSSK